MASLFERIEDPSLGDAQDFLFTTISNSLSVAIGAIFKVGKSGANQNNLLSNLYLRLKKVGTPASSLIIEIREATATTISNVILGTETLAVSGVTTSFAWVDVGDFSNLTLVPNTYYAIVLRAGINTGTDGWGIQCLDDAVSSYGSYAYTSEDDGQIFSTELSDESGVTGTHVNLYFRQFGILWTSSIVSYPMLLAKAGAGANATSKGFEYASYFVSNSEGYVFAVTRYDWSAVWTTLNEKAKYLITDIIACLAAIEIINYDYTGYSSRFEAREVVDTLQARADYGLELLRDQSIQDFIKGT